jgi:hypothetical protein
MTTCSVQRSDGVGWLENEHGVESGSVQFQCGESRQHVPRWQRFRRQCNQLGASLDGVYRTVAVGGICATKRDLRMVLRCQSYGRQTGLRMEIVCPRG